MKTIVTEEYEYDEQGNMIKKITTTECIEEDKKNPYLPKEAPENYPGWYYPPQYPWTSTVTCQTTGVKK